MVDQATKGADVTYSVKVRAEYPNRPGMLGTIASRIGQLGGDIAALELVHADRATMVRDITINATGLEHGQRIIRAIRRLPNVRVRHTSEPLFNIHRGGKIELGIKAPMETQTDLSLVYTPGVGRVSMEVHRRPEAVWEYTSRGNTVAIVTDGTAVLGLGDIGPEAALPVMEGKAMLFKHLAGVDAWPICLATKDPEAIVQTVKLIAPGFGGVNLEDISAPRCFTIEERLKKEADIPIFHDDQHGTAVVVLAGLINALKIVKKEFAGIKVVLAGVGAAGMATALLLQRMGVPNIIGCDRGGTLYRGREREMNPAKIWLAERTNPENIKGALGDALVGADVFLGLSGPGLLKSEDVKRMGRNAIVFAMANPVPEIYPEEAAPYARVMATGRSDYPNQINNALGFPGIFRGVLDVRAREINEEMKIAAASAIASQVRPSELSEQYIIPGVFHKGVVPAVASAVAEQAYRTGGARLPRPRGRGSRSAA